MTSANSSTSIDKIRSDVNRNKGKDTEKEKS